MKKLLIWIMIAMMGVTFPGCGGQASAKSTCEIVVVPSVWSDDLDRQIENHVKDRPELNVYQNMAEEADALYQSLLVEDLVAQEVDAICLEPVDPEILRPAVEQAEKAGVRVITGSDFCAMIDRAAELLQAE